MVACFPSIGSSQPKVDNQTPFREIFEWLRASLMIKWVIPECHRMGDRLPLVERKAAELECGKMSQNGDGLPFPHSQYSQIMMTLLSITSLFSTRRNAKFSISSHLCSARMADGNRQWHRRTDDMQYGRVEGPQYIIDMSRQKRR